MPERTFVKLQADGIFKPVASSNGHRPLKYDLAELVPAYVRWLKKGADPMAARASRDRTQAQLNEIKRAMLMKTLLPRDQVLLEMQMVGKAVSARIRAMQRHLVAIGLVPAEREADLAQVIYNILEELSGLRTMDDLKKAADSA